MRTTWNAAADASPVATWACPPGWLADFSDDIKRIDVPTLILHGTADRILPIDGQGRRLHAALPDARYVEIEGGPHVMCVDPRRRGQPRAARVPAPAGAGHRRRLTTPPLHPASKELNNGRSIPDRPRAIRPGDRRRNITATVPLRARARRRPQSPRRPAGRADREAASRGGVDHRSGCGRRRPSPHRQSRLGTPGRCRSSSTCTAEAGSWATQARTTGSSASSPSAHVRRCCSSSTQTRPKPTTRLRSSRATPRPSGRSAKAPRKAWTPAAWRSPESPSAATWPRRSR